LNVRKKRQDVTSKSSRNVGKLLKPNLPVALAVHPLPLPSVIAKELLQRSLPR
jgi:hypothetical protein